MTEIDYLRKHPLDFTVEDYSARIRMFVCPITEGGCDDHPILQLHEPADQSDDDATALPLKEVAGALGWLLQMAASIVIDTASGVTNKRFQGGGYEIAANVVKYHTDMTAAIARSRLN